MSKDSRIKRLEAAASPSMFYGWLEIVRGTYDGGYREELARLQSEGLAKPSASLRRCYQSLFQGKVSPQVVADVPQKNSRGEEDA